MNWLSAFALVISILPIYMVSAAEGITPVQPVKSGGVYQIGTAAELYWLAEQVGAKNKEAVNASVVLTSDIKLNSDVLKADGSLNGDGSNFTVWTPIGTKESAFGGTFDGNGKTISGLYYNDSTVDNIGLFGGLTGTVKNLRVEDSYIVANYRVGGIASKVSDGGQVINCYNNGTVTGNFYTGGIVGSVTGASITDCRNDGNVTIAQCEATGSITAVGYGGGVAGSMNNANITGCCNTGTVTSYGTTRKGMSSTYGNIGGIGGYVTGTTVISDCYNTGDIISKNAITSEAGGITGYFSGSTAETSSIQNCFNTGKVEASGVDVGGISGYLTKTTVNNCYNIGNITSTSDKTTGIYIGGLIGMGNTPVVTNCYNTGNITANGKGIGGAIGGGSKITTTNCYYKSGCGASNGIGVVYSTAQADSVGVMENKTEAQFASGEIAYLLQGEQTEKVWGQTIGVNKSPVLNGKKVLKDGDNYINEFGISSAVTSGGTTTVTLNILTEGSYMIVVADYEDSRLNSVKTVPVVVSGDATGAQVISNINITLGTGDKVMLCGDLLKLEPLCAVYEVE